MKEIGAKCLTNINFTFGRKDLNKIVIEQSLENYRQRKGDIKQFSSLLKKLQKETKRR